MEVVWSEEAKQSLQNIYDAIFKDSPQNANHVVESLLDLGSSLKKTLMSVVKEIASSSLIAMTKKKKSFLNVN